MLTAVLRAAQTAPFKSSRQIRNLCAAAATTLCVCCCAVHASSSARQITLRKNGLARMDTANRRYCEICRAHNNNKVKPYRAEPEKEKLRVAQRLLDGTGGEGWKLRVLTAPEARRSEITSHWLTRRINEGKLIPPGQSDSAQGA